LAVSLLAACSSNAGAEQAPSESASPVPDPAMTAQIETVAREAIDKHNLRALIVQVTQDGQEIYSGAMGHP